MRKRFGHGGAMSSQYLLSIALGTLAAAADVATAAPLHVDAEIDPTAYVLSGNSIHVGIGTGKLRVDLGNFALAVPEFVHGNDGFDAAFDGYGVKLQLFPFSDEQHGMFAGVDGGVSRVLVQRQGTDLAARHTEVGFGVHIGYRISIVDRFYATPWIGVGYQFGAKDATLAGATYKSTSFNIFPAVHLGYQFL